MENCNMLLKNYNNCINDLQILNCIKEKKLNIDLSLVSHCAEKNVRRKRCNTNIIIILIYSSYEKILNI